MDRNEILNRVEDFSAEQLAEYITEGIVTLDELRKTEKLDNSKRQAIQKIIVEKKRLIDEGEKDKRKGDAAAWELIRYTNSELDLLDWINRNPDNVFLTEAKDKLRFLEEERRKKRAESEKILESIRKNPNSFSVGQILDLLNKGILTNQDLLDCEIPQSAIDSLPIARTPELKLGRTPDSIPEGFTEVYFWGYKGSGKTCALGAILHAADNQGLLNIVEGTGFKYAYQIMNIFSDDGLANDFLPAPTNMENTQYLPFTLKSLEERHARSVSLIELSGEIFTCFFYKMAEERFPSSEHEQTFDSLHHFLSSENRKMHFFFIDCANANRPNADGLRQGDYLNAAANYFNNNDIFKNSTDAIYVVLTKSDLLTDEEGNKIEPEQRLEFAKKYLQSQNYTGFINVLKSICKKHGINGGKLTVEPFSLGKVYFRDICDFDGTTAKRIVDILMDRIQTSRKSFFNVLNQ